MLSVYCNGFWPGFLEGTDPVSVGVFLELLSKTFETPIVIVHDPQEADILLESLFGTSILRIRTWKYTVFFSGECRICPNYQEYDCVLWGETTKDNVVCCPEFITYLYSTRLLEPLENTSAKHTLVPFSIPFPLPHPRICVIISNPGGQTRNHFLDILDRYFQVDYVGRYRTNTTQLTAPYTSEEFRNFVKKYRCIVSMENSRGGDYVTEKITHGLLSGVVPIYWGATNVGRYFNTERFIHLEEWDEEYIGMVINHVMAIMNDDEYYKNMVSQPCFVDIEGKPSHRLHRTLDHIATDMRVVFLRKEN
uniref:Fucosyltransferase C-terminal domain-containing protein n=1 Tax=viral metagenome TaxID=1070528 RepID=A0A6C0HUK6_9ZZZZ